MKPLYYFIAESLTTKEFIIRHVQKVYRVLER